MRPDPMLEGRVRYESPLSGLVGVDIGGEDLEGKKEVGIRGRFEELDVNIDLGAGICFEVVRTGADAGTAGAGFGIGVGFSAAGTVTVMVVSLLLVLMWSIVSSPPSDEVDVLEVVRLIAELREESRELEGVVGRVGLSGRE